MSILDTVTPSSWKRTRISNGEVEYFSDRDWKHEALFEWEPQYSQSLLASLTKEHEQRMAECKKLVLLEAADVCEAIAEKCGYDVAQDAVNRCYDELCRMAEGKSYERH
jgi:hypothetical protein